MRKFSGIAAIFSNFRPFFKNVLFFKYFCKWPSLLILNLNLSIYSLLEKYNIKIDKNLIKIDKHDEHNI